MASGNDSSNNGAKESPLGNTYIEGIYWVVYMYSGTNIHTVGICGVLYVMLEIPAWNI